MLLNGTQNLLSVPGTNVRVSMTRNKPDIFLMASPDCVTNNGKPIYEIENIFLMVRFCHMCFTWNASKMQHSLKIPIVNFSTNIYQELRLKMEKGEKARQIISQPEFLLLSLPKDVKSWHNSSLVRLCKMFTWKSNDKHFLSDFSEMAKKIVHFIHWGWRVSAKVSL